MNRLALALTLATSVHGSTNYIDGRSSLTRMGTAGEMRMMPQRMPGYFAGEPVSDAERALVIANVLKNFPGALREEHFVQQLHDVLHSQFPAEFGDPTLIASSLCCDE